MTNAWSNGVRDWLAWGRKRVAGPRYGVRHAIRLSSLTLEDRLGPAFVGGVAVAAGDITGDGFVDIVTAAGPGAVPTSKCSAAKPGRN